MTRQRRRWSRLLLLVVAALAWVALLSLPVGGGGAGRAADGATARVTRVDDRAFPKISSYGLLRDAAGQPIDSLQAADFSLTEDGVPVQFDFAGAGQQSLSVFLVIDRSGSMHDDGKMEGAQAAARTFIDLLRPGRDQLGIEVFSDDLQTLVPLGALHGDADKAAADAAVSGVTPNGNTYLYSAVADAARQMRGTSGRRVIVALTDGRSNDRQMSSEQSSAVAKEAGIPVYTIGLGGDVDEAQLRSLAEATGGQYAFAPTPEALQALYRELAKALQNEYRFTYTSPTPRLDGTRRTVAVVARRTAGTLLASDDYAVSGVLVLQRNTLVLLLLGGGLLVLLAVPSLLVGVRKPAGAGVPPPPAPALTPEPSQTPRSSSGRLRLLAIPLHDERTTIGSAPGNDIVLPGLAPRHAAISRWEGRWVIEPLAGSTAVAYNGDAAAERPIAGVNALKHGSLIRLGTEQAIFQADDEPNLLLHTAARRGT